MSTFHPATSSLANFKNTISTISTNRFFIYISSRQEPTFVMASQLELFLPANSYTTHLLSSKCATNEGIAVLEVWSNFPFTIKRILGIKRIFPCSFANKRMRLLTRVYGTWTELPCCITRVRMNYDVCTYVPAIPLLPKMRNLEAVRIFGRLLRKKPSATSEEAFCNIGRSLPHHPKKPSDLLKKPSDLRRSCAANASLEKRSEGRRHF